MNRVRGRAVQVRHSGDTLAPQPQNAPDKSSEAAAQNREPAEWQWTSLIAIALGIGIVVLVAVLHGSALSSLLQLPAALIVAGGTLAATLVSYSPRAIADAVRAAYRAFRSPDEDFDELSAHLVALAIRGHRRGLLSLDPEIESVRDPFLRNGLTLVVDGASREDLQAGLRTERLALEAREDVPPRIFETAAGYAPTLGILGAVIGLMRVMESLATPAAVGHGIATAFVATIYGLGAANLILLPIGARLRERAAAQTQRRELVAEALFDVHSRLNPRMVAHKARSFALQLPGLEEIAKRVPLKGPAATRAIE